MHTPTTVAAMIFTSILASSAHARTPSIRTANGKMLLEAENVVILSEGVEHNIAKESTVIAATERVDKLEDEMKLLKVRDGTDPFSRARSAYGSLLFLTLLIELFRAVSVFPEVLLTQHLF